MQRRLSSSEPSLGRSRRGDGSARPAPLARPAGEEGGLRTRRAVLGLALALGVTIAIGAILSAYELLVLGVKPWAEGHPHWSPYYIARSGAALACAGLLLLGIERGAAAGAMTASQWRLSAAERAAIGAICLLVVTSTGVFVYDPALFFVLGSEDHVVETLSVALLFAAALCCGYAVVRAGLKQRTQIATLGLFGAAFLLIGLEEISWFQRVLDLDTPAFLAAANQQAEMNFHNLYTDVAELLYYGTAFCVLILFPYFCLVTGHGDLLPGIPAAAVGVFLIAASAPLAGYNYDMWNILPIQITFFATCLILARLIAGAVRSSQAGVASLLGLVLLTVAASQIVFLALGENFIRLWDVTEYKELLIASGCFCLALGVVRSGPAR
jgi:hypothetical protein